MLRYLRLDAPSRQLGANVSIIIRPTVHLSALRDRYAVDGKCFAVETVKFLH